MERKAMVRNVRSTPL